MPKGKKGKALDPVKEAELAQQVIGEQNADIMEKQKIERLNAAMNTFKINSKYIGIFQKEKTELLKQESTSLAHSNINSLDTKNKIVSRLVHDLEESEIQFSVALQAHLVHIKNLAALQDNRCHSLLNNFDAEKTFLDQIFNFERSAILGSQNRNKRDVFGVLVRLDREYTEKESDMKHEWNSSREDIKSKHLEEKHALRIQLEGTIEDLWRHFQSALDQYTNNTEEKRRQFQDLKTKDAKNSSEIDLQMKKLVSIQDHIASIKLRLSQKSITHLTSSRQLQHRKQVLSHAFRALKKTCTTFQAKQHTFITEMLSSSQKSIKQLEKKKEMADKIMTLHLLIEKAGHHGFLENATLNDMKLKTYLEVQMEKNAVLKEKIGRYMDGWNVREDVMDSQNSLLMVNGKPLTSNRDKRDHVPVTDGNISMQAYAAQGY